MKPSTMALAMACFLPPRRREVLRVFPHLNQEDVAYCEKVAKRTRISHMSMCEVYNTTKAQPNNEEWRTSCFAQLFLAGVPLEDAMKLSGQDKVK